MDQARHFYEEIIGLSLLGSFVDHDGFDGVIFGVPDKKAQLELVSAPHEIIPRPSIEDALILYCEPATATEIVERLRKAEMEEVPGDATDLNPYWPRTGAVTFVDPDGYRLTIARS